MVLSARGLHLAAVGLGLALAIVQNVWTRNMAAPTPPVRVATLDETGARGVGAPAAIPLLRSGGALSLPVLSGRVPYIGPVAHIFFHSLIVYPRLAFTGDRQSRQFGQYMITRDQFQRILVQLHARGYVLIDIRSLYQTDATGRVSRRALFLPAGKKPLVISLDDLSYYTYMRGRGFAEKLVLDHEGRVATQMLASTGERRVTRNGDVVPILDDFVRDHPDFSVDGAKGLIALTGFEGVLGYRTQADDEDADRAAERAREQTAARPVIAALKATGWHFASHSYSHNHKFRSGRVDVDYVTADAARWQREVGTLVGPTDVFVGPFGQIFKPGDRRRDLLLAAGFHMLCGVGVEPMLAFRDGYAQMDRADIDGYRLDRTARLLEPYFNAALVGGRHAGGEPPASSVGSERISAAQRAEAQGGRAGSAASRIGQAALAIGRMRKGTVRSARPPARGSVRL